MHFTRIYWPANLAVATDIELDAAAARHIVTVLRLKRGALLHIFNERDGEFEARLEDVTRDRVRAHLLGACPAKAESPLGITLVQAVSRGERMDFTVQKAVELGVSRVVPVLSRRSVVRLDGERARRRQAHWQQIATAACEQCGRTHVPPVEIPTRLEDWLAGRHAVGTQIVLDTNATTGIAGLELPAPAVTLLVGPEGGLAPEESALAAGYGFQAVKLGPRILRTETAALVCLALLQYQWGDLQDAVRVSRPVQPTP